MATRTTRPTTKLEDQDRRRGEPDDDGDLAPPAGDGRRAASGTDGVVGAATSQLETELSEQVGDQLDGHPAEDLVDERVASGDGDSDPSAIRAELFDALDSARPDPGTGLEQDGSFETRSDAIDAPTLELGDYLDPTGGIDGTEPDGSSFDPRQATVADAVAEASDRLPAYGRAGAGPPEGMEALYPAEGSTTDPVAHAQAIEQARDYLLGAGYSKAEVDDLTAPPQGGWVVNDYQKPELTEVLAHEADKALTASENPEAAVAASEGASHAADLDAIRNLLADNGYSDAEIDDLTAPPEGGWVTNDFRKPELEKALDDIAAEQAAEASQSTDTDPSGGGSADAGETSAAGDAGTADVKAGGGSGEGSSGGASEGGGSAGDGSEETPPGTGGDEDDDDQVLLETVDPHIDTVDDDQPYLAGHDHQGASYWTGQSGKFVDQPTGPDSGEEVDHWSVVGAGLGTPDPDAIALSPRLAAMRDALIDELGATKVDPRTGNVDPHDDPVGGAEGVDGRSLRGSASSDDLAQPVPDATFGGGHTAVDTGRGSSGAFGSGAIDMGPDHIDVQTGGLWTDTSVPDLDAAHESESTSDYVGGDEPPPEEPAVAEDAGASDDPGDAPD